MQVSLRVQRRGNCAKAHAPPLQASVVMLQRLPRMIQQRIEFRFACPGKVLELSDRQPSPISERQFGNCSHDNTGEFEKRFALPFWGSQGQSIQRQ
jgi:hypothetical protein